MKVLIVESCAGSDFVYSRGQTVESNDPVVIEHLKDLIKGELATEVKGDQAERAMRDTAKIEKR
jgi:hypothetical protein